MSGTHDEGYGLIRLGDTGLTLEDPAQDVRGRRVCSGSGEEIGIVEDHYGDEEEREVRFLDVRAGGLLGIGEKHLLVPVGAVSEVKEDRITVETGREQVLGSPPLDAKVAPDVRYQREVPEHYRDFPHIPLGP